MLLPRTCEGSVGDQRLPALARTALPPFGGLALAWEDYGATQLSPEDAEQGKVVGEPEVVVHFAPTHPQGSAQLEAEYFEERWNGADGSAWGSRWTSEGGTFQVITQRGAGQVTPVTPSAPFVSYVNDKTALNVDLVTSVRLSEASRAGLVTRRADSDPTSYLAFQFGSWRNEPWRTYAMLDGVRTDIQVLPPPNNVPVRGAELAYWMRFRTVTQADGSLLVAARVWNDGLPEPEAWLFETTLPVDSLIAQRLSAPGRFGPPHRVPDGRRLCHGCHRPQRGGGADGIRACRRAARVSPVAGPRPGIAAWFRKQTLRARLLVRSTYM